MSNVIKRAQCSCYGVISALHHVPLFMDVTWLLLLPVKNVVATAIANKVCSDSNRNKQVEMSVCRSGSSANATFNF